MPFTKRLFLAVLALAAVTVAAWVFIVQPSYREAGAVHEHVAQLRRKSEGYAAQVKAIDRLTEALDTASARITRDFKSIPVSPNIAGLMRDLSLPVDNLTIHDQTFTAGQRKEVAAEEGFHVEALPLTVDMVARFDAVFALLRAAESQRQLVRISSVNITSSRDDEHQVPLVQASVRLEAIYEPMWAEEAR